MAGVDAILQAVLNQLGRMLEAEVRLILGVEKELKKLESELECIKSVLADAGRRQVKEESVKVWLEKLMDVAYEADDVLEELMMHKAKIEGQSSPTRKVLSFVSLPCLGCNRVALPRDLTLKIKAINHTLKEIATEKEIFKFNQYFTASESGPKSTSFIHLSSQNEVQGRDVETATLISQLLSHKNQDNALNIVSIVGVAGLGKTTLAQLVYNSHDVIRHFDRRIWACVSQPFDEFRVAKSILEYIEGSAPCLFELETLARKIRNYVQGHKFLLVLDDVWTRDFRKWEQLFNTLTTGAPGSTLLVTTRNESVAKIMGSTHLLHLENLSDVDSWSLFKKIAFSEQKKEECEQLEIIGRMIVKKCKGLPLAVKAIGSLLRFKNSLSDWQDVLDSEFWDLEEAEGLSPPLMLSYCHLPVTLKRCFLYCAIFPKGCTLEANNLIQLWMAQGYLASTEKVEMEVIGQEYLRNLAIRSFFQDLVREKQDGERILSLKMHDMVHEFAHYLTKKECSVVEFNNAFQPKIESSHKRVRHLTVVRAQDTPFPNVPHVEKLFTLSVQPSCDSPPIIDQLDQIEPDFIHRLACVRALDLSRNRIGELSKEIGNLIKLKYLNLSYNPIWELPETLCDLYNLETLKLSACYHLRRLPSRIGKLVKLRHLEIDHTDSLKTLPKGIGNLKLLQTLSKFMIVRGNDSGHATCGLEDLKNLNNLRGCLKIKGLGYAADADEAKKAELHKKIYLSNLEMDFSPSTQTGCQGEVIEALEVHENLQSLRISSYGGTKFSNSMLKLINLQKLFLQDCENCTILPPLGRLPSLVTLHLEGMKTVHCLGLEFVGICANNSGTMNGEDGLEALSAFRNLEKLNISKMENWEEWDMIGKVIGIPDENFKIMPRLRCLKISHCSKLKELPLLLLQRTPLRKLHVDNCRLLLQQYNRETGKDWSKISHIPKIRIS